MKTYPNLTLYQAYKNACEVVGSDTAIYYSTNKITFNKLLQQIDKWASILQKDMNIQKGDSVLIALPNIPQTIILLYAVNKIGAIANMVHPYTPAEGIQKYYDESHSKVAFLFDQRVLKEIKAYKSFKGDIVICEPHTYFNHTLKSFYNTYSERKIAPLRKNTKFLFFKEFRKNGLAAVEVPLLDNETSVLLHSASTTGVSKTIKLSSKSFNFTASRVTEIMCMSEEELHRKTMISVLPAFHGFGLCMTMHAPLVNGFAIALIPKYSPANVSKMMNRCRNAISICGVPSVFKSLLNEPSFRRNMHLSQLKSCFSGGDSLPSNIKENFDSLMIRKKSSCRLFEGYGLTEALSVCAVNTHKKHKFGSIGYPVSGVEFAIFDDNDNILTANEVGEIAIKSNNNMLGYYDNDKATSATYSNGYLKTGDIGYIDEDGFLFFVSRKKRVIKVSGVAVFPLEIESVIGRIHTVKGVCAIQIPDEHTTNAVKVFVMSDNHNKEEIIEECRKHLISWSIPKEIEFVNKLPYTKYHKVNFAKLQEEENKRRGLS